MKSMRIIFAKLFLEIGEILHSMFSGVWPGVIWLLTFVAGFLAPAWPPIVSLVVLVIIDMRTGVKAAKKRGEAITSKCRKRSVDKAASYFYLVIAALIVEKAVLVEAPFPVPLLYMASALCAAVEFKSISENVYTVTGVNLWTRVKDVLLPSKNKNSDE